MPRCHRTCVRTSRRSQTIYCLAPDMLTWMRSGVGSGRLWSQPEGLPEWIQRGRIRTKIRVTYPWPPSSKGIAQGYPETVAREPRPRRGKIERQRIPAAVAPDHPARAPARANLAKIGVAPSQV